jgi:hypothetical protein
MALGRHREVDRCRHAIVRDRNVADPARKRREHIRQLEALGYKVSLEPAA